MFTNFRLKVVHKYREHAVNLAFIIIICIEHCSQMQGRCGEPRKEDSAIKKVNKVKKKKVDAVNLAKKTALHVAARQGHAHICQVSAVV